MTAKSTILLQLISFFAQGILVDAQHGKRIWVLREPDQLVEYNSTTFAPIQTVKIPPEAFQSPDRLLINRRGQMLFNPKRESYSERVNARESSPEVWFWNGKEASFLDPPSGHADGPPRDRLNTVETDPDTCFRQTESTCFFLNKNKGFTTTRFRMEAEAQTLRSTLLTVFVQLDLNGSRQEEITAFSFPFCECPTGACLETCPEAEFWAPRDSVRDFFFVTHLVPGQLGTKYQDTFLFSRSGDLWTKVTLSEPIELMLDAGESGRTLVAAELDGGCCGWDNESNDRTILFQGSESIVLFDERERFANSDYDVSFFTTDARLSANAAFVAVTISTSARNASEIRLSSDGKEDDQQLNRIRTAIQTLPAVEVFRLDGTREPVATIPRATLIGWISESEVAFVEGGHLVIFDGVEEVRRESQLEISDVTHVFIR